MIDVHTHVPTHRDAVPPDEAVVNDKWRPDRPVSATTTWAEYDEAFADVDVSVAFTIARDRERVRPRAQRRRRRLRGGRAGAADRLPLRPSGGRRASTTSSSGPRATSA